MVSRRKAGRWESLFGKRMPFEEELPFAKTISSKWSFLQEGAWGQANVDLEPIEGWLAPMWGSDERWIYLRRPEGIWKFELPRFDANFPVQLRLHGQDGQRVGSLSIGAGVDSRSGWFWPSGEDLPMDAANRDDELRAWAQKSGAPADQLGGSLDRLIESGCGRTAIQVGDAFGEPPKFRLEGDWLIATDKHGWRAAYSMLGCKEAKAAMERQELWLAFSSPWMEPFSSKVDI